MLPSYKNAMTSEAVKYGSLSVLIVYKNRKKSKQNVRFPEAEMFPIGELFQPKAKRSIGKYISVFDNLSHSPCIQKSDFVQEYSARYFDRML